MDKDLIINTILELNDLTPKDIDTWQDFTVKKDKIKEILSECDDNDNELNRRRGTIQVILERKQLFRFYLIEDENGEFNLPKSCDMNNPETFETLMLFDELTGVLKEISEKQIYNNQDSSVKLDDELLKILGVIAEAPYEKLDKIIDCLLVLTHK